MSKIFSLFSTENSTAGVIKAALFVVVFAALLLFLMSFRAEEESPDFSAYEAGDERKEAFFSYFLPIIEEKNAELLEIREELIELKPEREALSFFERRSVERLVEEYELEEFEMSDPADWDLLIRRIDIVPPSLALAQAANESAWGTSRFAQQGNNFYGHWCYVQGCGMIPARRPEGARHEVADFDSPEESVERYLHNLNHHPAYQDLRQVREQLRAQDEILTGLKLVPGLDSYSERGEDYIEELASMIRFNELTEYDLAFSLEA